MTRWLYFAAVLAVGVGIGAAIALLRGSHTPASAAGASSAPAAPNATWKAGARRAPDFALVDQQGRPVSVARFRGRPVIVTFMDPLCSTLCPLEAQVLERVSAQVPAGDRPEIVSVSVNKWGNARRYLLEAMKKWHVGANWHWAVGSGPALARVWRAYQIAVLDQPKTVHGVVVHDIAHTEASFLVDRSGHVRALYLYPFGAADVARTLETY